MSAAIHLANKLKVQALLLLALNLLSCSLASAQVSGKSVGMSLLDTQGKVANRCLPHKMATISSPPTTRT